MTEPYQLPLSARLECDPCLGVGSFDAVRGDGQPIDVPGTDWITNRVRCDECKGRGYFEVEVEDE